MVAPILAFCANRSGVGKTSLVYHLAWMLSEIGERVLACDLDPQANLTVNFLSEDDLISIWCDDAGNRTIHQCIHPLTVAGILRSPDVVRVSETLGLLPGDIALSGVEIALSDEWHNAQGDSDSSCPFRILTGIRQVIREAAETTDATVVLVDLGPGLGALNRAALIATDHIIVPLGPDLLSLLGLRTLGPVLKRWKDEWSISGECWSEPEFPLPSGNMKPVGYVIQQHGVRFDRPGRANQTWANRIPDTFRRYILDREVGPFPSRPVEDENCLASIRHYLSLIPMAQEVRKPIFHLKSADGAIGSHAMAVSKAYSEYERLAKLVRDRIAPIPPEPELHQFF